MRTGWSGALNEVEFIRRLYDLDALPGLPERCAAAAGEVHALILNWDQTRLDGRQPILIRTADRVGEILHHLGPHGRPQARYAYST